MNDIVKDKVLYARYNIISSNESIVILLDNMRYEWHSGVGLGQYSETPGSILLLGIL